MTKHQEVELIIKEARSEGMTDIFKGVIHKISDAIVTVYWSVRTFDKGSKDGLTIQEWRKYIGDIGRENMHKYIYMVDVLVAKNGGELSYVVNKVYDAILIEEGK